MENALVPLILQIRERIRNEKNEYLSAVEGGNPSKAKEIAERITMLEMELEKLQPRERRLPRLVII